MCCKFRFNGKVFETLNQKLIYGNFCSIGYNFNVDIIELMTTAKKLGIKLIIVEPQRLIRYLSQEELVLFRKSEFESSFSPNKIILGVLESDFGSTLSVRLLLISIKTKISFLFFFLILFFYFSFNF
jgi:hypothetical protein